MAIRVWHGSLVEGLKGIEPDESAARAVARHNFVSLGNVHLPLLEARNPAPVGTRDPLDAATEARLGPSVILGPLVKTLRVVLASHFRPLRRFRRS